MKKNKKNITLLVLTALALVAMAISGKEALSTLSALNPATAVYYGEISLNEIGVKLQENEADVTDNTLLADLKNIAVGKVYSEKIGCKNETDNEEYVRLVIRKYWSDKDGKRTNLDPELIELKYGDKDYNDAAWILNEKETTKERKVYYLKKALPGNKESELLFDSLRVSHVIAKNPEKVTREENGKTIITFVYAYDSCLINVEAEVQSVQANNADKAAASVWGNVGIVIDPENKTVKAGA